MIIRVRVEDEDFEVEVGDLASWPVVAVVDGVRFEVWPSGWASGESASNGAAAAPAPSEQPLPRAGGRGRTLPAVPRAAAAPCDPAEQGTAQSWVRAPIPGVVDSIAVRPGDSVARGQDLLVLEAMKMKNVIRAPRAGVIAAVQVAAGQHVKHNDPLVQFAD